MHPFKTHDTWGQQTRKCLVGIAITAANGCRNDDDDNHIATSVDADASVKMCDFCFLQKTCLVEARHSNSFGHTTTSQEDMKGVVVVGGGMVRPVWKAGGSHRS